MRGSARSCAAWVLTSLIAAACSSASPVPTGEEADPHGEITTGMRSIPAYIDPQRSGTSEQDRHNAMVFEGLMTFDPKSLAPIPAAAKDQPTISPDGLTYTFTLRDGLTYSDGSPLRARDFVYAFSRVCDPTVRSPAAASLHIIAGCAALSRLDPRRTAASDIAEAKKKLGLRANGDKEFVVTLTEPAAYFTTLAALQLGYPVRESDVMRSGAAYGTEPATFIGNGPFRLIEWKAEERLVFERDPHYRTPAKLKRWTKVVVGDELAFAAYRNNELDLYGGVPSGRAGSVTANLETIEADPELRAQVVNVPGAFTDMWILNVSRAPFTDRRIRQAFAKVLDRLQVIPRGGEPARSFIPPGQPGHDPSDSFQVFDPVRAKELLASSEFFGRPELSTLKVTYPVADPFGPVTAELLQQQLKRNLGIPIGIEAADDLTLRSMYADPTTAPQIRFLRLFGAADPQARLTAFFHSSGSVARSIGYRNAEFDAMVRDADREREPLRRMDLYRQASRILSEDSVAIWQWWGPHQYLRKPHVRGISDSGVDAEYGMRRLADIYVVKKR